MAAAAARHQTLVLPRGWRRKERTRPCILDPTFVQFFPPAPVSTVSTLQAGEPSGLSSFDQSASTGFWTVTQAFFVTSSQFAVKSSHLSVTSSHFAVTTSHVVPFNHLTLTPFNFCFCSDVPLLIAVVRSCIITQHGTFRAQ